MLRSHFLLAPFAALFGLKHEENGQPPDMPAICCEPDPDWQARIARQRRLVAERRIVETVTEDRQTEGHELWTPQLWTPQFYGLPDDALLIGEDRNWQRETHHIRWAHESFEPTERGRIPIWNANTHSVRKWWGAGSTLAGLQY